MNAFIQQNKKLFKFYYLAARVIGWLIILLGCSGFLILLIKLCQVGWGQSFSIPGTQGVFVRSWFKLITTGLITLGVAQFIRYLLDVKYHAGWLLRYGNKILYAFALFVVWNIYVGIHIYFRSAAITDIEVWLLNVLPMLLLNSAKILVMVGLAQVLKRVMPMIEESRTLV